MKYLDKYENSKENKTVLYIKFSELYSLLGVKISAPRDTK